MWRWCCVALIVFGVAGGTVLSQDLVDDQFLLIDPRLTVEVFHGLGSEPCTTINQSVAGTGWSFIRYLPTRLSR